MNLMTGHAGLETEIQALFAAAFSASEGDDEGEVIRKLVEDMIENTPKVDLYTFTASVDSTLVGCIFFSRLRYLEDERTVFILSPVGVHPDFQNKGIGQKLLSFGLDHLKEKGVDVAITYGDPAYYSKVGFKAISEEIARAPLTLNQPHGWLAQALNGTELKPLKGPSRCVEALNKPELW